MATEPDPPPVPRTPIRNLLTLAANLDPSSDCSTLTSLSSLSQSSGKSSSPSRSYPLNLELNAISSGNGKEKLKSDGETTPNAANTTRNDFGLPGEASDALKNILTPQKALPSTMTLVPDDSPSSLREPELHSTDVQRRRKGAEGRSSSEQEIWVPNPQTPHAEWPQEEVDDLIHCLKEDGLLRCLYEYLNVKKYSVPKLLRAFGKEIPDDTTVAPEQLLEKLQSVMRQALRNRSRIENYTTVGDAVKLLWRAQKIMVLTGAGISGEKASSLVHIAHSKTGVSCGVPDFRSSDGIYARIKASGQYEDLEDPQEMFSLKQFTRRPSMFYSFIGQLWPKDVQPSISHEFIRLLETKNKLLRNYTQNIDSMELVAGVQSVFHCHGSFATAKCMDCHAEVPGSTIHQEVIEGKIPRCAPCVKLAEEAAILQPKVKTNPKKKKKKKRSNAWDEGNSENDERRDEPLAGVMKPGITFFGEKLCDSFDNHLYADRDEVDLLLIIGTSLKVKPVSEILAHIPHSIPQILINKTPVEHANPDIVLLGDCDKIIEHLCHELEWVIPSKMEERGQPRRKRKSEELNSDVHPKRLGNSHIWLFEDSKIPMPYARRHDPSFTRERKAKRPRLN